MIHRERALSEIVGEILIIGLVVALAIVIIMIAMSGLPFISKSPYLATKVSLKNLPGYSAIALYHQGGESVEFTDSGKAPYLVRVTVGTPSGSFPVAVENPGLTFGPGDTVYIYYNGTGYSLVSSLYGITGQPLPSADIRVNLVDTGSSLLIQQSGVLQPGSVTPVATPVETTSVTTTATTAQTTTMTTTSTMTTSTTPPPVTTSTSPTATSTTMPVITYSIRVSWSPAGLGYVSVSLPVHLTNPATVTVNAGSSATFAFVPNANKAVKTIRLGGMTVYSGSSQGATVTYTVNNVRASTTLTATFG